MVKRICLLVNYNAYESKRYFTEKLAEALNRKKIETKVIDVKERPIEGDLGAEILNYEPDLTCSFNSITHLPDGKYLWDVLQLPHWSILLDPVLYSIGLINSPYSIISCVDRFDVEATRSQNFQNIFFWPHATEADIKESRDKREYDVVMLGSCYDYESLKLSWQQRFPKTIHKVLDDAISIVLSDRNISLADSLVTAWNAAKLSPVGVDFMDLFFCLDYYVRGRDRVELVRSVRDAHVHVFGMLNTDAPVFKRGWKHYMGSKKNVTIHSDVNFNEALNILKKSKICLNSVPSFKNGTHERVFSGLACGSLPLASHSIYLEEQFVPNKELLFYQPGKWDTVSETVSTYLADEGKRADAVAKGRKKVMQHHTWDNRVEQLLQELPPILKRIK